MIAMRLAVADDVPVLRRMLQALSDHDRGGPVGSEETLLRHGFGDRPLFHAILADRGADSLGMVLFYPDYSTMRGQPGTYVQDLWVDDVARGLGLGKSLIGAAQRFGARDWGSAYVTLGVDPANTRARSVYARLGFRPRGYEFLILDGSALQQLETA